MEQDLSGARGADRTQVIQRRAHILQRHCTGTQEADEGVGRRHAACVEYPLRTSTEYAQHGTFRQIEHASLRRTAHRGPAEALARQTKSGNWVLRAKRQQLIEEDRQYVEVDVAIDQEGVSISKGVQKPLNLAAQLQPNLFAQARSARTRQAVHAQPGEPSLTLAPPVDKQIDFGGGGERRSLKQAQ